MGLHDMEAHFFIITLKYNDIFNTLNLTIRQLYDILANGFYLRHVINAH